MLVLSRYRDESLVFEVAGLTFEVVVNAIEHRQGCPTRVKLGIVAPAEVRVTRKELKGTGRDVPRSDPKYRPRGGLGWGQ